MLKFTKNFSRTCHPVSNIILHQYFSVMFMGSKEFDPPVFDFFIKDIDDHDLHGKISKLLGKPYLSPIKYN